MPAIRVHYFVPMIFLAGCYPEKARVSVVLPEIKLQVPVTTKLGGAKPTKPNLKLSDKKMRGLPSVIVATDMQNQQDALRQKLERESNQAIQVISEKLRDFYKKEIDEFYNEEIAKLGVISTELSDKFKEELREAFERYAKLRAPVITRLALLVDFPLPKQVVKIDEEGLDRKEILRRTEIRELQLKLFEQDKAYEEEIAVLKDKLTTDLGGRAEKFSENLDKKQDEINDRALQEASRQVRRFGQTMTLRLFPDIAEKLPEVPGRTAKFETSRNVKEAPTVRFVEGKTISSTAILNQQLTIWANLNRYELVEPGPSVRDATAEFTKWLRELKQLPK
jgi:hypothetical protein